jgi:DEAD/DEAH box helicase domain-containing protein
VRRGLLRRRPTGWYWTRRERPTDLADLRGVGGPPVRIVEASTGRLLGTVDPATAHGTVHTGAVYLHQGETFLVVSFDVEESVALVEPAEPEYATWSREVSDITIVERMRSEDWGTAVLTFGSVDVTNQVVGFVKKRLGSGEVLGEERLDLPERQLRTRAVWWTAGEELLAATALEPAALPGAAHAAEHASIGLLPLFATCDRWDIGGVSTALHPDTGQLTVFVYDGHPGGAGFAERGYRAGRQWLRSTLDVIEACRCADGCPSCVQSPKCGNGNEPLDKAAAAILLRAVLGAGHAGGDAPVTAAGGGGGPRARRRR